MMGTTDRLALKLASITVFCGVKESPAVAALTEFLRCGGGAEERMERYSRFVASLAQDGYSLSCAIRRAVYTDENPYIVSTAKGEKIPPVLQSNALRELEIFSELTRLTPEDLWPDAPTELPRFDSEPVDFSRIYARRLADVGRCGYGVFAGGVMFRVEDRKILPVASPDPVTLDHFVGYEEPRRLVVENTKALLEGRPAANILLYGDAGTGKSSTVKACANRFSDRGLRLIEMRRDQLMDLPYVMGQIHGNPLKFILFVDDLSFSKQDDSFSMLKAALEGSASAKTDNAVIYATSNRRHIVRESFSDRSGDEIHRGDTMQELLSLSDRFGRTVYFEKPNKAAYLDIVHELAKRFGVSLPPEELDLQAEAFALAKGSRSPRAAEQLVRSLTGKM